MDILLKATAGVLLTIVIGLILSRHGKDYSTILIVCVCCMIASTAIGYYQKIFQFIDKLEQTGNLNRDMIAIILKAVGISLLSEITVLICSDAGNAALGKSIQILSSAIIVWICIPLFVELLDLVENILGYL